MVRGSFDCLIYLFIWIELVPFIGPHAGVGHLGLRGGSAAVGLLVSGVAGGIVGGGEILVLGGVRL